MGSMRSYSLLLCLLVLLACVAAGSVPLYPRDKPRSIRGFKNHALSTARGFGKRAYEEFTPSLFSESPSMIDRDSFPADWFADEMQNNADLARLVVHKFIDSNQDGDLSAEELLRPLYEKQPQTPPLVVYK